MATVPKVTQITPDKSRSRSMSPNNPLSHDIDGYVVGSKQPITMMMNTSTSPKLDKNLRADRTSAIRHRKRGNSQEN